MPLPFVFAMLASLLAFAAQAAEPLPRPDRLGMCVACHGEDGRGRSAGMPHLAGQDAIYLAAALEQYRNGKRREPVMRAAAGGLSAGDIQALARWYAAQPACGQGAG